MREVLHVHPPANMSLCVGCAMLVQHDVYSVNDLFFLFCCKLTPRTHVGRLQCDALLSESRRPSLFTFMTLKWDMRNTK